MTGPEHYRAAEQRLGWATAETDRDKRDSLHASAQVHATLALAAATALNDAMDGTTTEDWNAWRAVASLTDPPKGTP